MLRQIFLFVSLYAPVLAHDLLLSSCQLPWCPPRLQGLPCGCAPPPPGQWGPSAHPAQLHALVRLLQPLERLMNTPAAGLRQGLFIGAAASGFTLGPVQYRPRCTTIGSLSVTLSACRQAYLCQQMPSSAVLLSDCQMHLIIWQKCELLCCSVIALVKAGYRCQPVHAGVLTFKLALNGPALQLSPRNGVASAQSWSNVPVKRSP